jgi:hypothetical protein
MGPLRAGVLADGSRWHRRHVGVLAIFNPTALRARTVVHGPVPALMRTSMFFTPHSCPRPALGRHLGGERRRFARAFEAGVARGRRDSVLP